MLDFRNFFYFSYWTSQPRTIYGWGFWFWLGFFLLLLAAGVGGYVYAAYFKPKVPVLWQKIGRFGVSMGLSGLILFFFREEHVILLGWRVWFLFWGIIFVAWFAKIMCYASKRVPAIQRENFEREEKQKYLPDGQK